MLIKGSDPEDSEHPLTFLLAYKVFPLLVDCIWMVDPKQCFTTEGPSVFLLIQLQDTKDQSG